MNPFGRSRESTLFGSKVELAAPPRSVTMGARIAVVCSDRVQVAFLIAGILSVFFWIFAWDSEAVTRIEFRGSLAAVEGKVTNVYATSASENKRTISGVVYAYEVAGTKLEGESFTTGRAPPAGSTVTVEYLARDPGVSRIAGLRRRRFGATGGIFGVVPILAAVISFIYLARGLLHLRLLRTGQLGFAKLVESKPTGGRVNKRPVIAYTFELELPAEAAPAQYRAGWKQWAKTHRFTFKTHQGSAITDEPLEPVLYEPTKPGSGIPLDALPLRPTPAGGLDAVGNAALRLLLPTLFIGVHGAIIVSKLVGG